MYISIRTCACMYVCMCMYVRMGAGGDGHVHVHHRPPPFASAQTKQTIDNKQASNKAHQLNGQ